MNSKVLVVVDMQSHYVYWDCRHKNDNELKSTIIECIRLVKLFKDNDLPIIFLHFKDRGSTIRRIRYHVRGYERTYNLEKGVMDGSPQVVDKLQQLGINPTEIHVCGLYADQCVMATVAGLYDKLNCKVVAHKNACYIYTDSIYHASFREVKPSEWKDLWSHPVYQHSRVVQA